MECLADYLGLRRFGGLGYSLGAAFGLACAYKLKKRIKRLSLVSSVVPFENFMDLEGMHLSHRFLLSIGKYAHTLTGPLTKYISSKLTPELFYPDDLSS